MRSESGCINSVCGCDIEASLCLNNAVQVRQSEDQSPQDELETNENNETAKVENNEEGTDEYSVDEEDWEGQAVVA